MLISNGAVFVVSGFGVTLTLFFEQKRRNLQVSWYWRNSANQKFGYTWLLLAGVLQRSRSRCAAVRRSIRTVCTSSTVLPSPNLSITVILHCVVGTDRPSIHHEGFCECESRVFLMRRLIPKPLNERNERGPQDHNKQPRLLNTDRFPSLFFRS